MAFYRQTYMPGYTTNDTYGSFYDSKKVSLITVPDRLKNYDLDVRKTQIPTSGSEYGEFLRDDDPYARQRYQEIMQQQQQQQQQQQHQQQQFEQLPPEDEQRLQLQLQQLKEQHHQQQQPQQQQPQLQQLEPELELDSPRDQPPPVSEDRYRHQVGLQRRDSRGEVSAEQQQHRLPRSRSPPPPPDERDYANYSHRYSGRDADLPSLYQQQQQQQQQQRQLQWEDQQLEKQQQQTTGWQDSHQLPALRYGHKEIRLPDIDAVELHMRDKSRVLLNVREFYSKYLRD